MRSSKIVCNFARYEKGGAAVIKVRDFATRENWGMNFSREASFQELAENRKTFLLLCAEYTMYLLSNNGAENGRQQCEMNAALKPRAGGGEQRSLR